MRLVGSYAWDNLKLTTLYQTLSDLGGVSGAGRNTWGCGAACTLNKSTLKVQGYFSSDTDGADDGASMGVVGLDYDLSPKTCVYLAYALTENDDDANMRMSGGGHGDKVTPLTGETASGISLGLMHTF